MKYLCHKIIFVSAVLLAVFSVFSSKKAAVTPHSPSHIEAKISNNEKTSLHLAAASDSILTSAHKNLSSPSSEVAPKTISATKIVNQKNNFTPSVADAKRNVNQLFKKFDNGGKTITSQQLIDLSKKQDITGSEAAMLAVLIRHEVSDNMSQTSDINFIRGNLLYKLSKKNSGLYHAYLARLARINKINSLPADQKLFGPGGLTANTNITQQYANDCYFLSPINSILKLPNGPKMIESMITPVIDHPNQFQVNFPGQKPITVNLTQTEIAMYSQPTKGGQWLAVLSAAESQRRSKLHLGEEAVLQPGYQSQVMSLFLGKNFDVLDFKKAANPTQITTLINNSLANSQPIGIEAKSSHYLSILSYDAKTDSYTLKNPWGTTEWYNPLKGTWSKSTAKPTTKGPWFYMSDGVFKVPASQITKVFKNITYLRSNEATAATVASRS